MMKVVSYFIFFRRTAINHKPVDAEIIDISDSDEGSGSNPHESDKDVIVIDD